MKGAELPINVMVIVVLAIIVLIAIVVLFFGVWNPGKGSISLEAAKNNACNMLVSEGCDQDPSSILISAFDADKNNLLNPVTGTQSWGSTNPCPSDSWTGDNLASLCACYYGVRQSKTACRQLCGCSA